MTIAELVSKRLPYGKKRAHLGGVFVDGIESYYRDEEKDLDEIYIDNFPYVIRDKKALNDIKIFAEGYSTEFDEILNNKGINVARRTVAKYREAMHIPSSVERRKRKRLMAS